MTTIEILSELRSQYSCFDEQEELVYRALSDAIKALSAQPEQIRCKDCKHRDPEDKKCDCGHGILWQLPRDDDWYCADAERKRACS